MGNENLLYHNSGGYNQFTGAARVEKDFRTLAAVLEGIKSDGVISKDEQSGLRDWLRQVEGFMHRDPYRQTILSIEAALADDYLSEDELEDIRWLCNTYAQQQGFYDIVTAGIQQLTGLLIGLNADNKLTELEIRYLSDWLERNDYLRNTWPYDELCSLVLQILRDNIVTVEELKALQAFAHTVTMGDAKEISMSIEMLQQGFCQVDPDIVLEGSSFCITGISRRFSRKELAKMIELKGGQILASVSRQLHYLVVCDEKNACWAYTCYGRKVEKAVRLRRDGCKIAIIHELDLLDVMTD